MRQNGAGQESLINASLISCGSWRRAVSRTPTIGDSIANVRDDRSKIGATLPLRPISKRKDDLDHKGLAGHGVGLFDEGRYVQLAYTLGCHCRRKAQHRGLITT